MSKIQLEQDEIDYLLKDEETCWKLHNFHCYEANLSENCYADKAKERRIIARHNERAKAWEDHVNDCIES